MPWSLALSPSESVRRSPGGLHSERRTTTHVCDYEKRPGRAHAVRYGLTLCEPTRPQGSHILTSMLGADAPAIIPSASRSLHTGDRVQVELLTPWIGCGL